MVSIKDVAEVAGVSTATISRVLANKPHVRPEVRDHVLAVVQRIELQAESRRPQSSLSEINHYRIDCFRYSKPFFHPDQSCG